MRRRTLLTAVGTASLGGITGCSRRGPVASGDNADDDAGDGATGANDAGDGATGADDADDPGDVSAGDWPSGPYADYETTEVEVRSADGDALGAVRAAIADTGGKRRLGLSDAESLPEDAGMLFVYDAPQENLRFIMPNMDFGIDIVYVDDDRKITRIHNAPEPGPNEDGSEQRYPGSGQYVLEVPYEWTDRHGVEVGDSLAFELFV
ncbi:DUF192 domain-containing protein [Halorubrum trueperi]|uniref:DUF192 domain-containing protein n=1 Tax=Halorubrum trueperi TaxID=2004704 RepID=A0ABD5UMH2_9EURY